LSDPGEIDEATFGRAKTFAEANGWLLWSGAALNPEDRRPDDVAPFALAIASEGALRIRSLLPQHFYARADTGNSASRSESAASAASASWAAARPGSAPASKRTAGVH